MPGQYAKWVDRVTKPYQILAPLPSVQALGKHGDPYLGHFNQTIPNPQVSPAWSGQVLNPNRAGAIVYAQYEANMYVPASTCGGRTCDTDIWGGIVGWSDHANTAF